MLNWWTLLYWFFHGHKAHTLWTPGMLQADWLCYSAKTIQQSLQTDHVIGPILWVPTTTFITNVSKWHWPCLCSDLNWRFVHLPSIPSATYQNDLWTWQTLQEIWHAAPMCVKIIFQCVPALRDIKSSRRDVIAASDYWKQLNTHWQQSTGTMHYHLFHLPRKKVSEGNLYALLRRIQPQKGVQTHSLYVIVTAVTATEPKDE